MVCRSSMEPAAGAITPPEMTRPTSPSACAPTTVITCCNFNGSPRIRLSGSAGCGSSVDGKFGLQCSVAEDSFMDERQHLLNTLSPPGGHQLTVCLFVQSSWCRMLGNELRETLGGVFHRRDCKAVEDGANIAASVVWLHSSLRQPSRHGVHQTEVRSHQRCRRPQHIELPFVVYLEKLADSGE